jgi:aminopeptidase N
MDFAVEVPQSVEQGYGLLTFTDNVLALAHTYPMVSVYDDEAWNAEIPRGYGDVTYADISFYIVKITAPKDLTLVPTGIEISHSTAGQTQVLTIANGPARDFYLVASANYQMVTETLGDVTIRSYAVEEELAGAQAALKAAAQSLEDFDKRYGSYPYTELDIVATPTNAAGIEYPGLVVMASNLYRELTKSSNNSAQIVIEAVVSHEVGHQWFYNLVGNDQLDDPWLDEAFAQLASLHYFQDEYGPNGGDGFQRSLEDRWERVEHAKIPIGLPVDAYTQKEYGAIVYGRGPLFLVALQNEMGDANFDEFVRDYVAQLSWGIATPEFMQALAEGHCACDLDTIFMEWVYPT